MNSRPLALVCFLLSLVAASTGAVRRWDDPATSRPETRESDAAVFRRTCAQCHPLVSPRHLTKADWPGQVASMRRFAAERALSWSAQDEAAVLRYLELHGR